MPELVAPCPLCLEHDCAGPVITSQPGCIRIANRDRRCARATGRRPAGEVATSFGVLLEAYRWVPPASVGSGVRRA